MILEIEFSSAPLRFSEKLQWSFGYEHVVRLGMKVKMK